MLELKNIQKIYPTSSEEVHALKGIDLTFRKNEFVSILGPSGCGKTTMLNIIGGLDSYTSGDLIINGTSTSKYKDRDWDSYRNHTIGFVFQSYNLIPHQTVLANVELALTLSGVGKAERRRRAKEALELVGLGNQLKKRPAEMSGGQMQRVAIARAIVNNPDIILADEPTGALDTETSVAVMEILKNIARDRLVIMVTHNPELAEKYSTRIVRMLDGRITDDSAPMSLAEITNERLDESESILQQSRRSEKKPSMSPATSFGLSLKNLFTKKGRTALTAFAGSIGIIGIALIYAVSQGTTDYINDVQEDTLASYPITLQAQTLDMTSLLETFTGKAESISEHENDAVYEKAALYSMLNALSTLDTRENDLKSFKEYLEKQLDDSESRLKEALSAISYSYDLDLLIYTKNVDGNIICSDMQSLMTDVIKDYAGIDLTTLQSMQSQTALGSSMLSSSSSSSSIWNEITPDIDGGDVSSLVTNSYDVIYGRFPENYDEIVLYVDENNELSEMTLYAMGLISESEIQRVKEASLKAEAVDYTIQKWDYEEICNMDFRVILNCDCYTYDSDTGCYTDLRDSETGLQYLYDNALKLKVVGIVKPNEDSVSSDNTGSIGYLHSLTEYVINRSCESEAVKAQKDNPTLDILSGLTFNSDDELTDEYKADYFRDYASALKEDEKAEMYIKMKSVPTEEEINSYVSQVTAGMTREDMVSSMLSAMQGQTSMDSDTINSYISSMSDEELYGYFSASVAEQYTEQYAAGVKSSMADIPLSRLAAQFDSEIKTLADEQCAEYYDSVIEFSASSYEDNLTILGAIDLDSPSTINMYASSFANKDVIEEYITEYNEGVDELSQIEYTDYIGIILSSVTTIIDAITYVLISFVSVSLVVSSIMIGVITLISVQERTKEIGILRAIGASKKNVSGMFNAETIIIGFISGILGVGITYLVCIPINLILHSVTGINNLTAHLPLSVAAALVIISLLLTLIAGIIPSRSAAKKDPVVALRTE